jgi:hypothetical protein
MFSNVEIIISSKASMEKSLPRKLDQAVIHEQEAGLQNPQAMWYHAQALHSVDAIFPNLAFATAEGMRYSELAASLCALYTPLTRDMDKAVLWRRY